MWISRGLKIQEAQFFLEKDMRKLGAHATETQRLALARRADRLASEVSAFCIEATVHLGADLQDISEGLGDNPSNDMDEFVDEDLLDRIDGKRPFDVPIPLPSSVGKSKCHRLGRSELLSLELKLRVGQANDTLHQLRLCLAEKAVVFRTHVRHAKSQVKSTRAWAKVHQVDLTIEKHASAYRRCKAAMKELDADEETLDRYKDLHPEDLKVKTSAFNPNERGLRYEQLSWFWNMDVEKDTLGNAWMSECKWTRSTSYRPYRPS